MPEDRRKPDNGENQPRNDYLGRILIGFIVLAAIFWTLDYIF